MAKKLLSLMAKKKTNLSLACDVLSMEELLHWAERIGPFICVLKTHVDILEDFTYDKILALKRIADQHNFLLFEDRKFGDIGQTVSYQYGQGIYRIAEWADLVNAHIVPGPGIIAGLKQVGAPKGAGLLLLAEMSSSGTLAQGPFAEKARQMGEENSDFVCGFIAQRKLSALPGMIHFTPGVKLERGEDRLGQRYRTVEEATESGADVLIVGQGILQSSNPAAAAALYRDLAWHAIH